MRPIRMPHSAASADTPSLGPSAACLARTDEVPRAWGPAAACPGAPAGVLDREVLFEELQPLVRRLIRQYGENPEFRRDLAGEIYCRFCDLLDAYDPTRGVPLRPYLIRNLAAAVYTYSRSQWRRRSREVGLEAIEGAGQSTVAVDPTRQWDQDLVMEQVVKALPAAIARLPQRQRQVVIWRYYEGRSFEEIAELLDVQPATARSLLRHGLNNLRRHDWGEVGASALFSDELAGDD